MSSGDVTRATNYSRHERRKAGRGTHGAGDQQRNLLNDLGVDAAANLGVFVVQRGGIGADFNALDVSLKPQLDVLPNRVADADEDSILHVFTEALRRHTQLIRPGHDVSERVQSVRI